LWRAGAKGPATPTLHHRHLINISNNNNINLRINSSSISNNSSSSCAELVSQLALLADEAATCLPLTMIRKMMLG